MRPFLLTIFSQNQFLNPAEPLDIGIAEPDVCRQIESTYRKTSNLPGIMCVSRGMHPQEGVQPREGKQPKEGRQSTAGGVCHEIISLPPVFSY